MIISTMLLSFLNYLPAVSWRQLCSSFHLQLSFAAADFINIIFYTTKKFKNLKFHEFQKHLSYFSVKPNGKLSPLENATWKGAL